MIVRTALRAARGALALVLAAAVATGGSAFAADDDPESLALEDDYIGFTLTDYGSNFIEPGGSIVVGGIVTNDSLEMVAGLEVTISVSSSPFDSRDQLSAWESGQSDVPTHVVGRSSVGGPAGIPAKGTVQTFSVAPTSDLGFAAGIWGVYGVNVSVTRDGVALRTIRTFATWLDVPVESMPTTVIASVTGAPTRAAALLQAASRPEVSLLVDPTSLGSDSVGPSIDARDTFLLPAGHVDVASLAYGDQVGLLSLALTRAIQDRTEGTPWIAVVPQADPTTVSFARQLGAFALLLDPASAAGPSYPLAEATSGATLVRPDPGLSLVLARSGPTDPTSVARVLAESAMFAVESDFAPVIVAPGSGWVVGGDDGSPVLDALLDAPWVDPLTLTDLLASFPAERVEADERPPADEAIPTGVLAHAARALEGAAHVAHATPDATGLLGGAEAALLHSFSYEGRRNPEERAAAIDEAVSALNEIRRAVHVAGADELNLISSSAELPVTVRNDLDADVTVTVFAVSSSPILRIVERPAITIPAASELQVLIPVTAVSSANITVSVTLQDDVGHVLAASSDLNVRVRAQWGDVFTAVVGGGFAVLLVAGAIRTIRRGRAKTRGTPQPEPVAAHEGR